MKIKELKNYYEILTDKKNLLYLGYKVGSKIKIMEVMFPYKAKNKKRKQAIIDGVHITYRTLKDVEAFKKFIIREYKEMFNILLMEPEINQKQFTDAELKFLEEYLPKNAVGLRILEKAKYYAGKDIKLHPELY